MLLWRTAINLTCLFLPLMGLLLYSVFSFLHYLRTIICEFSKFLVSFHNCDIQQKISCTCLAVYGSSFWIFHVYCKLQHVLVVQYSYILPTLRYYKLLIFNFLINDVLSVVIFNIIVQNYWCWQRYCSFSLCFCNLSSVILVLRYPVFTF